MIPHPHRSERREDAYFISNSGNAVGVADGVGGWANEGVDPSVFSNQLMREAALCSSEADSALELLRKAYQNSKYILGSATVCIAFLKDKSLTAVNVGDTGLVCVRGDKIIYKTEPQRKGFNTPQQVGLYSSVKMEELQQIVLPVEEKDIIILGTDGLLEYLRDIDILEELKEFYTVSNRESSQYEDIESFAERLAKKAETRMLQPLLRRGSAPYDDITALVSLVCSSEDARFKSRVSLLQQQKSTLLPI